MTRFINEGGKAPDCITRVPKEIQEQPAPTKCTAHGIVSFLLQTTKGDSKGEMLPVRVTQCSIVLWGREQASFFPNIISLLIISKFHTMYPDQICFPFIPGPPSHPCTNTHTQKKVKTKHTKSNCVAHILMGARSNSQRPSQDSPISEPFPIHTRNHQPWRATLQPPYHNS